jgi:hypothetical protein
VVKAQLGSDSFCNFLEVGKFKGKSEYFYDEKESYMGGE